ncbi:MAG: hypothetical protein U0R70_11375 [Solirubrobacteraceae bacterium]
MARPARLLQRTAAAVAAAGCAAGSAGCLETPAPAAPDRAVIRTLGVAAVEEQRAEAVLTSKRLDRALGTLGAREIQAERSMRRGDLLGVPADTVAVALGAAIERRDRIRAYRAALVRAARPLAGTAVPLRPEAAYETAGVRELLVRWNALVTAEAAICREHIRNLSANLLVARRGATALRAGLATLNEGGDERFVRAALRWRAAEAALDRRLDRSRAGDAIDAWNAAYARLADWIGGDVSRADFVSKVAARYPHSFFAENADLYTSPDSGYDDAPDPADQYP